MAGNRDQDPYDWIGETTTLHPVMTLSTPAGGPCQTAYRPTSRPSSGNNTGQRPPIATIDDLLLHLLRAGNYPANRIGILPIIKCGFNLSSRSAAGFMGRRYQNHNASPTIDYNHIWVTMGKYNATDM